jgi:hemolysin activation/secretion protein
MNTQRPHALGAGFALSLLAAAAVKAQTVPNIGDALRQVPSVPVQTKPAAALPQIGSVAFEPPMQQLPGSGPAVEVTRFEIVGNREIGTETLLAQLAQDNGKSFTLAELEAVASRLTRYYRSNGYFVARVYIPQQEVVGGVVKLRAVEGNYGKFILDNKSLVRDDIVQGMLDDVKKYNIVSLDTLERAMLIINDTPGSKVVRADVMPGDAVGTSDFAVGTTADPKYQGFVLLDNHGTQATGRNRMSFNWDWNSPTRSGDRLSVSGLASENSGLKNGRMVYSTSLTPSGWRGEMAAGRTQYQVSPSIFKTSPAPSVTGTADIYEMGLTYPIRRIRAQTVELALGYTHKRLEDIVDSGPGARLVTPKKSDALNVAINVRDEGYMWGFDGLTQASVGLTAGQLRIEGDALMTDQAAGGPQTDGRFDKFNASLSRVSLLPAQFSLTGAMRVQHTLNKNLDGTDRMGVAGVGGVMAYPSAELAGTNAYLARLELARPLPVFEGFVSQWSVFANWGKAQILKSEAYRSLNDVGIGWTASHANGLLIKTYLAYRTNPLPALSETTSRTKFWIQTGYVF